MFISHDVSCPSTRCALITVIATLVIGLPSVVSVAYADPGVPESPPNQPPDLPSEKPQHERLDSHLNELVDRIGSTGTLDIAGNAPISVGDLVATTIRMSHNVSGTVEFLKSVGAIVANMGIDYIEAYTPVTVLSPLSERDGVLNVRTIMLPLQHITSQGAAIHRAPVWNTRGYTGEGIKVGVIDAGFVGYSALMGTELPSTVIPRCYTAVGFHSSYLPYCETGTPHGTAVAETVVDMALSIELYIANPVSKGDLQQTAAWMVSEGVQVINMSLGYLWDGPGDGTSTNTESPLNTVDSAVSGGLVWVNSAGNSAARSWYGNYTDSDSDGILEFSSSSEYQYVNLEPGDQITVQLRWDDAWNSADSDLDLYLYEWDAASGYTLMGSSSDFQNGDLGQDPYEIITFSAPSSDYYYLFVRHFAGPTPEWFELLVWGADLSIQVSEHSITNPGDSANGGMLTVGAADWTTPTVIESFSSRGPTSDGRIKPDIVGVDGGNSASYGVWYGTSQASPHVAGLAALVLQRYPQYTPQEVATYLKDNASGRDTGPNNTWGYGLARLPFLKPTAPTGVIATPHEGQAEVTWSAPSDNGGSPITQYTVTSNPGVADVTATGLSTTIAGLSPFKSYTFYVSATNAVGTSSSSDSSNSVTPMPNVPSIPDLSQQSDTGVSDSDNTTAMVTATFTGTADPNVTVKLFRAGDILVGSGAADENGQWSIKSSSLPQGTNLITATATVGYLTSRSSQALVVTIAWDNFAEVPSLSWVWTGILTSGMLAMIVVRIHRSRRHPRTC